MDGVEQKPIETVTPEDYEAMAAEATRIIGQVEGELSTLLDHPYKITTMENPIRSLKSFTDVYGTDMQTIAKNVLDEEFEQVRDLDVRDYVNTVAASGAPKKDVYDSLLAYAKSMEAHYKQVADDPAQLAKMEQDFETAEVKKSKEGIPGIGRVNSSTMVELLNVVNDN